MNISTFLKHGNTDGLLLQPLWDDLRAQREFLTSPFLPACFAFLIHLLLCAPFLAFEALGCFWPRINLYRISRNAESLLLCLQRWVGCCWRIFLKYLTTVLPATALYQRVRIPRFPELSPSCSLLIGEVIACLLLFDALFFIWHYSMHRVPWLYQRVHQTHHQNRITFALTAQDASPAELLSLQMLALSSAWVVGCHPLSEALFHLLNTWLAIEDHCGYDLPWAIHRLLPCFGGAPFHQAHHHIYRGNYAPYFRHWDWLCGTYLGVREEAGSKHGGRTMRRRRRKKSLGSDCVCAQACMC
ncbi:cholesterol 25-hydroxylase-like protein [Oncorhynchus tshawytscha]|uniref:Fatty acid hydroxylase domain-containing protein n=1 Tax=Oncorhynchus tshawytscha TaxID=74940 RepID=A0A8C8EV31_ONCTS|nr:cholesterol 25-hydroxylase-like protein [Oncorhynchus tshawytscha]